MAPRRTVCTHITSIITNSSTSGGALAAAGSTHARGTLTLPTRDVYGNIGWTIIMVPAIQQRLLERIASTFVGLVSFVQNPGSCENRK